VVKYYPPEFPSIKDMDFFTITIPNPILDLEGEEGMVGGVDLSLVEEGVVFTEEGEVLDTSTITAISPATTTKVMMTTTQWMCLRMSRNPWWKQLFSFRKPHPAFP
jgi:hypothetical protein